MGGNDALLYTLTAQRELRPPFCKSLGAMGGRGSCRAEKLPAKQSLVLHKAFAKISALNTYKFPRGKAATSCRTPKMCVSGRYASGKRTLSNSQNCFWIKKQPLECNSVSPAVPGLFVNLSMQHRVSDIIVVVQSEDFTWPFNSDIVKGCGFSLSS